MVFDAEVVETDDLDVRAGGPKVVECGEEGEVGLEDCFLFVGEAGVVPVVVKTRRHSEEEDETETRTGITAATAERKIAITWRGYSNASVICWATGGVALDLFFSRRT